MSEFAACAMGAAATCSSSKVAIKLPPSSDETMASKASGDSKRNCAALFTASTEPVTRLAPARSRANQVTAVRTPDSTSDAPTGRLSAAASSLKASRETRPQEEASSACTVPAQARIASGTAVKASDRVRSGTPRITLAHKPADLASP